MGLPRSNFRSEMAHDCSTHCHSRRRHWRYISIMKHIYIYKPILLMTIYTYRLNKIAEIMLGLSKIVPRPLIEPFVRKFERFN